jgi:hypothetical protein
LAAGTAAAGGGGGGGMADSPASLSLRLLLLLCFVCDECFEEEEELCEDLVLDLLVECEATLPPLLFFSSA